MEPERANPSPPRPEPEEDEVAEQELKRRQEIPKRITKERIKKGPAKGLTVRERDLAKGIIAGKSHEQAAIDAGYSASTPESARSITSEVLKKPDVRAYLESVSGEAAEIVMKHAREAKSEMVSLIAAKDVLDRTGFKTPEPAKDPNQGATYNFIFNEKTREDVHAIESVIRARLIGTRNEENATQAAEHVDAEPQGPGEA